MPAVIEYIQEMASLVKRVIEELLDAVIVDRLFVEATVASGDAAETAMDYGKACAALYPAVGALCARVRVKRRRVMVTPDFLAEKGRIAADIRLHTQLWRLSRLLWRLIAVGMPKYLKKS